MCYGEDVWKDIKKYGVDKDLWDRLLRSNERALVEFRNMEDRIKKEKLQKQERERIDTYKKAILELKEESLI